MFLNVWPILFIFVSFLKYSPAHVLMEKEFGLGGISPIDKFTYRSQILCIEEGVYVFLLLVL